VTAQFNSVRVTQELPFIIRSRDQFGNRLTTGGIVASATVSPIDFNAPQAYLLFTDLFDGTYSCSFTTTQSGRYSVIVTKGNIHYLGSPFNVTINPGNPFAPSSKLSNLFVNKIVAGVPNLLVIETFDYFGNKVTTGGDLFEISYSDRDAIVNTLPFTDSGRGAYFVNILDKLSGSVNIQIELEGRHILNSPFATVVVSGKASAANSILFGSIFGSIKTGDVVSVVLNVKDSYDNAYSFADAAVSGNVHSSLYSKEISLISANIPIYATTLVFTVAGKYTLTLNVETVQLPSTPFNFSVLPGSVVPENSRVIIDSQQLFAGEVRKFYILCFDQFMNAISSGGEVFQILFRTKSFSSTSLVVAPNFVDNNYTGSLLATTTGSYQLSVIQSSKSVLKVPIGIKVVPAYTYSVNTSRLVIVSHSLVIGKKFTVNVYFSDPFGNGKPANLSVLEIKITNGNHIVFVRELGSFAIFEITPNALATNCLLPALIGGSTF